MDNSPILFYGNLLSNAGYKAEETRSQMPEEEYINRFRDGKLNE